MDEPFCAGAGERAGRASRAPRGSGGAPAGARAPPRPRARPQIRPHHAQNVFAQRQRDVVVEQPEVREREDPARVAEAELQHRQRQRPHGARKDDAQVGPVFELVVLIAQRFAVARRRHLDVHLAEEQPHEEGARRGLHGGQLAQLRGAGAGARARWGRRPAGAKHAAGARGAPPLTSTASASQPLASASPDGSPCKCARAQTGGMQRGGQREQAQRRSRRLAPPPPARVSPAARTASASACLRSAASRLAADDGAAARARSASPADSSARYCDSASRAGASSAISSSRPRAVAAAAADTGGGAGAGAGEDMARKGQRPRGKDQRQRNHGLAIGRGVAGNEKNTREVAT